MYVPQPPPIPVEPTPKEDFQILPTVKQELPSLPEVSSSTSHGKPQILVEECSSRDQVLAEENFFSDQFGYGRNDYSDLIDESIDEKPNESGIIQTLSTARKNQRMRNKLNRRSMQVNDYKFNTLAASNK